MELKKSVKEILEKEREADSLTILKLFQDCQNVIQFMIYMEK